jgi:hypothetical protein
MSTYIIKSKSPKFFWGIYFIFLIIIIILLFNISCSSNKILPADMRYNKEVVNKKHTKIGKLHFCNGKK